MVYLSTFSALSTDAEGNAESSLRRNKPPGLLVSVRSITEMQLLAGLDLTVLDIKEPHAGALAAASPEVWYSIATENAKLQNPWRLSVALGECSEAIELAGKVPASVEFAKAGPAHTRDLGTIQTYWETIRKRLSASTELVAVAYADHENAGCPSPEAIFDLAAQVGLKTWLIDTFQKDGSSTVDHLTTSRLSGLAHQASNAGAQWVLAGSVRSQMVTALEENGVLPDLFGVRGDICDGPREGIVARKKVQSWLAMLSRDSHPKRD